MTDFVSIIERWKIRDRQEEIRQEEIRQEEIRQEEIRQEEIRRAAPDEAKVKARKEERAAIAFAQTRWGKLAKARKMIKELENEHIELMNKPGCLDNANDVLLARKIEVAREGWIAEETRLGIKVPHIEIGLVVGLISYILLMSIDVYIIFLKG